MPILDKIFLFVEPMALAFLLVYAYGFLGRSARVNGTINVFMGCIFGATAVVAMLYPVELDGGVIVDIRSLFVGAAAAFFGVVGGAIALAMSAVTRAIIGGDGAILGIAGMVIAVAMGLVWAKWVRPNIQNDAKALPILGCMISVHLTVAVMLPAPVRETFFMKMAPTLMIAYIVGAFMLGKMLDRERALVSERDALLTAASRDQLTQLLNRAAAVEGYDAINRDTGAGDGVAMLCIDVDHFKSINDNYGHLRGDQVLVEIAKRMSSCLRPNDIFARMSGDEFVIVLHDLTSENAQSVADRCQRCIGDFPIFAEGAEIEVSVTIGCIWVQEMPAFVDFRFAADKALYRAKEKGRNCLSFIKMSGGLGSGTANSPMANVA